MNFTQSWVWKVKKCNFLTASSGQYYKTLHILLECPYLICLLILGGYYKSDTDIEKSKLDILTAAFSTIWTDFIEMSTP